MAVLIELGRGVPRRVPRAVDVGRRAKGRESKGKDEGEGDVNGDGGSKGDEGEEGDPSPFGCQSGHRRPPLSLSYYYYFFGRLTTHFVLMVT